MQLKKLITAAIVISLLTVHLLSTTPAFSDEYPGIPTSGVAGNTTVEGSARAYGDGVDVGVRVEVPQIPQPHGAAPPQPLPQIPSKKGRIQKGVRVTADDMREHPKYLRRYANRLYKDDSLEKPPSLDDGNYNVVNPCLNAPDQAACQQQEKCTTNRGEAGHHYYIEYTSNGSNSNPQRISRPICLPPEQAPTDNAPVPILTTEDLERLDIAPAIPTIQPAPHTLINYHTNMYAQASTQNFTTTLAGYPVAVQVYPIEYTWDYGDGTISEPTENTGYPLPEDQWDTPTPTSHQYTKTGTVNVTLTTTYEAQYSIAGGPWLSASGTATATSAPTQLTVWRTKIRNYADNCIQNPQGAGC